MDYKISKILDFSRKVSEDSFQIILGHNGSGKTRLLKKISREGNYPKKVVSESYPILLKMIIKIMESEEFLDGLQYTKISKGNLKHLNGKLQVQVSHPSSSH